MNDRFHPSPGSRTGSIMESPQGSTDMSMFPHARDLAGLHDLSANLASGPFVADPTVMNSCGRRMPNASSNPLEQWYTNNDGPWIPRGIANPGTQNHMRLHGLNTRDPAYTFPGGYRESISPSECDTLRTGVVPSDSGYGSNGQKQSIAPTSVCYEEGLDNQDTQSLVARFSDAHFPEYVVDSRHWSQTRGQQSASQHAAQPDGKDMICTACNKTLKTNSELKKHQHRHTKPYTCDVPNCNRTDGFSTTNDLDRHKKSCHPTEYTNGDRYQCRHGVCESKGKVWPRADNFRAHVKRVHHIEIGVDDLEKYTVRSPPPPEVPIDLAGLQNPTMDYSYPLDSDIGGQVAPGFWPQALGPGPTMRTSQQSNPDRQPRRTQVGVPHPTSNQGKDASTGCDRSTGRPRREQNQTVPENCSSNTSGQANPYLKDPPESRARPLAFCDPQFIMPGDLDQQDVSTSRSTQNDVDITAISGCSIEPLRASQSLRDGDQVSSSMSDVAVPNVAEVSSLVLDGLDLRSPDKIKQILEALQSNGVLKVLGYKKDTPTEDTKGVGLKQDGEYTCPQCPKFFSRQCELKKHMKRHEKPYGCTFQNCHKKFGSKNDWKRHENSQHYLLEVWRCDVKDLDKPSEKCGRVSHRRETFRQHLSSHHHLTGDLIDRKLEECRVGRNCETQFWCGFCRDIIVVKQKSLNAWTERYNHIDDHYSGRNGMVKKQVDDWKDVDPEAPQAADVSESDSDSPDIPPVPLPAIARKTAGGSSTHRQTSRTAGTKRKADATGGLRHPKRARFKGVVVICCRCSEGNTHDGMNPQCINSECQHILCPNCSSR